MKIIINYPLGTLNTENKLYEFSLISLSKNKVAL